jgi:hypothetical protein
MQTQTEKRDKSILTIKELSNQLIEELLTRANPEEIFGKEGLFN